MRLLPSCPLDEVATHLHRTPLCSRVEAGAYRLDRRPVPLRFRPCLSSVCRTRQHTASCVEHIQRGHMRCLATAFPETASCMFGSTCLTQSIVHAVGASAAHVFQNMSVNGGGDVRIGVAEDVGDNRQRHVLAEHDRGGGVPQVVVAGSL